jgi:hypothetical protein
LALNVDRVIVIWVIAASPVSSVTVTASPPPAPILALPETVESVTLTDSASVGWSRSRLTLIPPPLSAPVGWLPVIVAPDTTRSPQLEQTTPVPPLSCTTVSVSVNTPLPCPVVLTPPVPLFEIVEPDTDSAPSIRPTPRSVLSLIVESTMVTVPNEMCTPVPVFGPIVESTMSSVAPLSGPRLPMTCPAPALLPLTVTPVRSTSPPL